MYSSTEGTTPGLKIPVDEARGRLLVYDEAEWRSRQKRVVFEWALKMAGGLLLLYLIVYALAIWSSTDLLDDGYTLRRLRTLFPACTAFYLMLIIDGVAIVYLWEMRRPTPGIYQHGLQLPEGEFVPYLAVGWVFRDRRQRILPRDRILLSARPDGGPRGAGGRWSVPFSFLGMDGLVALVERVKESRAQGPPEQEPPRLVVYGEGDPRP